jgi:SAM-dependent methyltransferase
MLGHILLLILIILAVLIIFSSPDKVSTPETVSITPMDEAYADIVNTYLVDVARIKEEARIVKEHVIRPHTSVVLGSSTGHLVHELNTIGVSTTGVDESKYMVRRARDVFPHTYTQGEYTSDLLFQEQSLSHVVCFNYTLCFIQDKAAVFRTVHTWLERGGLFFVHVPHVWNYGPREPNPKYTAVKLQNTLREKAVLDKTYTLNRHVYLDSKESICRVASQNHFELYRTISMPLPYLTDQVLIFKSVDPVYL